MSIVDSDYKPILPLRNGHINTVCSSLFRKTEVLASSRRRIDTHDNDFLDIDFLEDGNSKIVILCHGLEGSSSSKYMLSTSSLLHANGYDVAAMNYRYCSGEINRQLKTYHSGDTEDLHTLINFVISDYQEIYLVGFSLGGNIVLKHLGDGNHSIDEKIKAAVAVSVPVDLYGGALQLLKRQNWIYSYRFLRTLKEKMKMKYDQFPNKINISDLKKIKTLIDFDDYYTSSVNGFKDAKDYYAQSSSKQFLHEIKKATLLINSQDDPFLSDSCYPYEEVKSNKYLSLMTPKFGGHVGFISFRRNQLWIENQILNFIEEN